MLPELLTGTIFTLGPLSILNRKIFFVMCAFPYLCPEFPGLHVALESGDGIVELLPLGHLLHVLIACLVVTGRVRPNPEHNTYRETNCHTCLYHR